MLKKIEKHLYKNYTIEIAMTSEEIEGVFNSYELSDYPECFIEYIKENCYYELISITERF